MKIFTHNRTRQYRSVDIEEIDNMINIPEWHPQGIQIKQKPMLSKQQASLSPPILLIHILLPHQDFHHYSPPTFNHVQSHQIVYNVKVNIQHLNCSSNKIFTTNIPSKKQEKNFQFPGVGKRVGKIYSHGKLQQCKPIYSPHKYFQRT